MVPMNGREIRNAISTARQLAMWKHEVLGFKHFQVVIKVATKFNEYLLELNRGRSRGDILRYDGSR